jgi:hypothetical protein
MSIVGIISFFLSPLGRYAGMAGVALVLVGGIYIKGRSDGKASYQAKLTREINTAIEKGDRARAEALNRFDSMKDYDDGFFRD